VERVGPYEIVRTLGEGGMGVVYLAQQQEPIRRLVALKVVKAGARSERVLARFHAERRALARLNHPNVAQVYDTGTAEDGSPYIVMEHVPGDPITAFCDGRQATVGERVELFIDVCRGVQHVHQKGLIHRDLKPPNILVADQDGRWIPKIIDFGIAKGSHGLLTDEDLTRDNLVGTPMYIAPEALKGEEHDTRVDVYALGLVLYRLLIGVKPAPNPDKLHDLEMIRKLARGEAVPSLTSRFRQLTPEQRVAVGRNRKMQPRALRGVFARDLDWIVMRAIHVDPDLRYATPMELAGDLQRYLDGEAVIARPPSLVYIGAKTLRRHRWMVGALSLLIASLIGGVASTAYQAREARRAAVLADMQRLEAEQVAQVMGELFSSADPYRRSGAEPTVREVLDSAAETIKERDLPPAVQVKLLLRIADSYRGLGKIQAAGEITADAVELAEEHAPGTEELALGLALLASFEFDRGRYDDSEALARRCIDTYVEASMPADLQARPYATLSHIGLRRGDLQMARQHGNTALKLLEAAEVRDPINIAATLQALANAAAFDDDLEEAKRLLNRAMDELDRDLMDVSSLRIYETLAKIEFVDGKHEKALEMMEEVLDNTIERLGEEHGYVSTIRLNTAVMHSDSGHPDKAEPLFRAIVDLGEATAPAVRTAALINLGHIELRRGNAEEAEGLYRLVATGSTDRIASLDAHNYIARAMEGQGRHAEAAAAWEKAIRGFSDALGAAHVKSIGSMKELAGMYDRTEQPAKSAEARARIEALGGG